VPRNRRQEETFRKVLAAGIDVLRESSYADLTVRAASTLRKVSSCRRLRGTSRAGTLASGVIATTGSLDTCPSYLIAPTGGKPEKIKHNLNSSVRKYFSDSRPPGSCTLRVPATMFDWNIPDMCPLDEARRQRWHCWPTG
jgi:hypothetical protein